MSITSGGGEDEDVRRDPRCGSFRPGHDPYAHAVIKAEEERPHLKVYVLDAPGGDVVRLTIDELQHRLHNHDPRELLAVWEQRTGPGLWIPGVQLLRVPRFGGAAWFNLSTEPIAACPVRLAEQVDVDAVFTELVDGLQLAPDDEDGDDGATQEGRA
jgi:hypothetical protein